jgi:hypothetical protein
MLSKIALSLYVIIALTYESPVLWAFVLYTRRWEPDVLMPLQPLVTLQFVIRVLYWSLVMPSASVKLPTFMLVPIQSMVVFSPPSMFIPVALPLFIVFRVRLALWELDVILML